MRLGFVIHRYGQDFSGGAEAHCRALAGRLTHRAEVEIITTTAQDYTTWQNFYPGGEFFDQEVLVRRFKVAGERHLRLFDVINRTIMKLKGRSPIFLEKLWLRTQGPYAPDLLNFLKVEGPGYDRLIFYTYLYEPTIKGLPLVRDRAWLIPTAHDEPALGLKIMRPVFEQARGLGFLSPAESDLVNRRFNVASTPQAIIKSGVAPPDRLDSRAFAQKYGLDKYLLYLGRLDYHKGLPELLDFWAEAAQDLPGLKLVLAGEEKMNLPLIEGVVRPGFITEDEKWSALAGAAALIAPSPVESLNLTVLEAGAVGRPVLVNGRCPVLAEYVAQSGAGLAYRDLDSFKIGLSKLSDPVLAQAMGWRGRELVRREFSWEAVDKITSQWLAL